MMADIRWITPLYGFGPDIEHIGVPEQSRNKLQEMVNILIGTSGLVATYIPEGTDEIYRAGIMRGKVVGAVRLLGMPSGRSMEDYFYEDWDGTLRWPIGWPCEAVYAPDISECPVLRQHVESLFGPGNFASYVSRFQQGPFELEPNMQVRLNSYFAQFQRIA